MMHKVRLELFEKISFNSKKRFSTKTIKYVLTPIYYIVWIIQLILSIIDLFLRRLFLLSSILYKFFNVSPYINNYDYVCFNYILNSQLFNNISINGANINLTIHKKILLLSGHIFSHSKFTSKYKYEKIVDLPIIYSHLEPGTKIVDYECFNYIVFPSKLDIVKKYFTTFEKYDRNDYLWNYTFGIKEACVI